MRTHNSQSEHDLTLPIHDSTALNFDQQCSRQSSYFLKGKSNRQVQVLQIDRNGSRAETLGITMNQPKEGYGSIGIGVFLIMIGFCIKSFIALVGILSSLPFLLMGLGGGFAIKHFITSV